MEIQIFNAAGKKTSVEALPERLVETKVVPHMVHDYTRWQRNKKRAGTHTVLTRAEARGGGAKPWKQKGTGRARAGSNTSPLWVGGGIAHGPKQRSYEFSLNRKERKMALQMVLRSRFDQGKLLVVADFGLKKGKTQEAEKVLRSLNIGLEDAALVVIPKGETVLERSLRNIPRVKVVEVAGLNVYDVLKRSHLVVVGNAWTEIKSRLG